MAPTLSVLPFDSRHIGPAAELLAARHARDRKREPLLSAAFESPEAARPLVEALFQQEGVTGVVAMRDGALAGFLLATAVLPAPTHFIALFFPPRSMAIPYHGHAVASQDGPSIYRELYAALAGAWVRRGFFDHFVHVPDKDQDAREAWDSLGFGRDLTCAVRDVGEPVAGLQQPADLAVHQAGPEDISVIEALNEALAQHHARSPIFAPNLPEPHASSREMSLQLLADPANAHFVAYQGGAALGMQTFMPPRFLSPMLAPEACVYLLQGIVYPEARSGGVGRSLLAHSMAWAHAQGHRWCALHFVAPNLSGARYWLGNAFRPVEHRLRRRIDERIAWAGG